MRSTGRRRSASTRPTDTILEIISAVLDHPTFFDKESAAGLGELLADLLADEDPAKTGRDRLIEFVRSARRRLKQPPRSRCQAGSREALLAMAERPWTSPPAPRLAQRTAVV